jgi:hypothetical protein
MNIVCCHCGELVEAHRKKTNSVICERCSKEGLKEPKQPLLPSVDILDEVRKEVGIRISRIQRRYLKDRAKSPSTKKPHKRPLKDIIHD